MSGNYRRTFGMALGMLLLIGGATAAATPPAIRQSNTDTLRDRIEYGLETSPIVRRYDVRVRVNGDDVILSGDVATQEQKDEAARIAKIAGASKIQNSVVVDPKTDRVVEDRIRSGRTKTGEKLNDKWIESKVMWFLAGEEMLKGNDIDVKVDHGVVKLKGNVRDQAARERAVTLTRDTEGVTRVVDELKAGK